jgi:hypothetical protein
MPNPLLPTALRAAFALRLLRLYVALGLLLAGAVLGGAARAQPVAFSATGTWDADAPLSVISAPGASWSLVFQLADLMPGNPSAAISGFSYTLGGAAVALEPTTVSFFGIADSGMFDVDFGNAPPFSAYGSEILVGGSLLPGSYDIFVGVDGGLPAGSGSLQVVVVPEPAAALSLLLGLGGLGVLMRRRRAMVATATPGPLRD